MIESKRVRLKGRKAQLHIFLQRLYLTFQIGCNYGGKATRFLPLLIATALASKLSKKPVRCQLTRWTFSLPAFNIYIFPWILIMDPMSVLHYMLSRKNYKTLWCWVLDPSRADKLWILSWSETRTSASWVSVGSSGGSTGLEWQKVRGTII